MRLTLAAAALALLAGCPSGGPWCNSTSCPDGCCGSDGDCYVAVADRCGSGGGACTLCASDEACDHPSQTCVPRCRPDNCAGCCRDGTCHTTSETYCGEGGQRCVTCGGGTTCDVELRRCLPSCRRATCSGCCSEYGSCRSGTDKYSCGGSAEVCKSCSAGCDSRGTCECGSGGCVGDDGQCYLCNGGTYCTAHPYSTSNCSGPAHGLWCCGFDGTCAREGEDCKTRNCCGESACLITGGTTYTCRQYCKTHLNCRSNCCKLLSDGVNGVCSPTSECQ